MKTTVKTSLLAVAVASSVFLAGCIEESVANTADGYAQAACEAIHSGDLDELKSLATATPLSEQNAAQFAAGFKSEPDMERIKQYTCAGMLKKGGKDRGDYQKYELGGLSIFVAEVEGQWGLYGEKNMF